MANQTKTLYPLLFEPSLHAKVWGGRLLETRLGKSRSASGGDEPLGESWEIFWKNRVSNGPAKGQTLGDLIRAQPLEMVGSSDADPEFPLLIKFLDANDWLSVQVHPNDALAKELEGEPRGKTECWYIIDAKPGAQIIYGLDQPLDADGLRKAIEGGRAKEVFQYVTVQAGDFVYVPAGTLHALGPGILLYELQQTSDTTYRVYDWDRNGLDGKPRELHIEKSLKVSQYDMRPQATVAFGTEFGANGYERALLIDGQYFSLERLRYKNSQNVTDAHGVHALTVLRGALTVSDPNGAYVPVKVVTGQSVFIPAQIAGSYTVAPDGEAEVLRASCP